MEQFKAEKISIFRKCKLEEINLPFLGKESLDEIPLDAMGMVNKVFTGDEMDLDQELTLPQELSHLRLDFSRLAKKYRQVKFFHYQILIYYRVVMRRLKLNFYPI